MENECAPQKGNAGMFPFMIQLRCLYEDDRIRYFSYIFCKELIVVKKAYDATYSELCVVYNTYKQKCGWPPQYDGQHLQNAITESNAILDSYDFDLTNDEYQRLKHVIHDWYQ